MTKNQKNISDRQLNPMCVQGVRTFMNSASTGPRRFGRAWPDGPDVGGPHRFTNTAAPRFDGTGCWQQHLLVFWAIMKGVTFSAVAEVHVSASVIDDDILVVQASEQRTVCSTDPGKVPKTLSVPAGDTLVTEPVKHLAQKMVVLEPLALSVPDVSLDLWQAIWTGIR